MEADEAAGLRVTVAWSPGPREVQEWTVIAPAGATVREALAASGLSAACPDWASLGYQLAVWGRAAAPQQRLQNGDRVEVLRALRVDPKVARRERFRRQGVRSAGLFARKNTPPATPAPDPKGDAGGDSCAESATP